MRNLLSWPIVHGDGRTDAIVANPGARTAVHLQTDAGLSDPRSARTSA